MPTYKIFWSDEAQTTLAAPITTSSPSLQVVGGGGALFPAIGAAQAFLITLFKSGSPGITEVMLVTGRTGDNFTGLVRNYSGSGALAWDAGDIVAIVPTAEAFTLFMQAIDLQMQSTNFAIDTGSASAYRVILSPTLNASTVGMPIRFSAAHDNALNPTFTDGVSTGGLIIPGIGGLPVGAVRAGGIYTATWDGTNFQLATAQRFDMIAGSVNANQVPQDAVTQYQHALSLLFTQLTDKIQNGQIADSIALPASPTTTTQAVGDNSTKISTTAFVNKFVQRGIVHVGDVNSPVGGAVTFPFAFAAAPVVTVSLIDANSHGASAVAAVDGIPTTGGFNWAAREIATAVEDAYIHWHAVST